MTIPEDQLETWSHQGAIQTSAATYQAIREVLNDPSSPHYSKTYKITLQGSYGNDTNIRNDSDVDVTMCLTSTHYTDTTGLNAEDKARYERNRSPATYSYKYFKIEVLAWLTKHFGSGVKAGRKAIFIPGSGNRRDADVLVCASHRKYWSYSVDYSADYADGICFWTTDGTMIVNYPKQHMDNCTTKHQETSQRFKRNIRVLKNMRNVIIDKGLLKDGVAPSYFIEGMLWNVPNQSFVDTYRQTFLNYIKWLDDCETTKLLCANRRHWLLRDSAPVCWNHTNFKVFRNAAVEYWNNYSSY